MAAKTSKTAIKTVSAETTEGKRIATNAARAVLKGLPEHVFNTGAVGRDLKTRVTIGGETFFVAVQVVLKPKAVKVAVTPEA